MIEISVIIPYFNKFQRLKQTISSLNQQVFEKKFEVIIVDDGSFVPLEEEIKMNGIHIRFPLEIIRVENKGRSAARNTGVSHSKGNILLFIDDDVVLPENLIHNHYNWHKSLQYNAFVHSKVMEDISLLVCEDLDNNGKSSRLSSRSREKVRFQYSTIELLLMKRKNQDFDWCGFIGNNVSVKKEVFHATIGFRESFIGWGCEDFDMGYQLIKNGVSFIFDDTCVIHLSHKRESNHNYEMESNFDRFYQFYQDEKIHKLYLYLTKRLSLEEVF